MKSLLSKSLVFLSILLLSHTISAQKITSSFFQETSTFLQNNVVDGRVKYARLQNNASLQKLIKQIENADLAGTDEATQKAFKINAYNLHVINAAAKINPLASVQSEAGFFDRQKITVAGEKYTLNNFEKKEILKVYNDPRLHFVLVCGAVSCPPIIDEAYQPDLLEAQLEQQTKIALNDSEFIRVNNNTAELSKIFDWYSHDFGGNKKAIFAYINNYRSEAIPSNAKLTYYTYDWSLNDATEKKASLAPRSSGGDPNNASRYIVSSTIPKGSVEVKVFNNLYTQRTGLNGNLNSRSTFFTTSISALYGLTNRINVGLVSKYRRVENSTLPSDAIDVFKSDSGNSSRQRFTGIGPQIRFAPKPEWQNFSIQSSFTFPIGDDLAGGTDASGNVIPYIDWNGPIWNTQFFNDLAIGSSFSLFTEVDVLLEDIGKESDGHVNRWSTPATVIFSYTPTPKIVLYTLGGFSPYWQSDFDYFIQGGFGAKYQFTPNLELELLYTGFRNKSLLEEDGRAATYNLGLRFNL